MLAGVDAQPRRSGREDVHLGGRGGPGEQPPPEPAYTSLASLLCLLPFLFQCAPFPAVWLHPSICWPCHLSRAGVMPEAHFGCSPCSLPLPPYLTLLSLLRCSQFGVVKGSYDAVPLPKIKAYTVRFCLGGRGREGRAGDNSWAGACAGDTLPLLSMLSLSLHYRDVQERWQCWHSGCLPFLRWVGSLLGARRPGCRQATCLALPLSTSA